MARQRRFKQLPKFEYRPEEEAIDLRKQAEGMSPGVRRDDLLRKAAQLEAAVEIKEWLISSGLRRGRHDDQTHWQPHRRKAA